jgi:dephospho-CoA kinase
VLSTDAVVHELYGSPEVRDRVVARWGAEVAPNGAVDRSALAARAFASDDERRWLEGLLWPLVGQRIVDWRTEVERADPRPPAAVIEVPLLFESGMDAGCDATLAIVAPEALRRARASERGHAALDQRTARQLSQDDKAAQATYAVVNDGTVEQLEAELSAVLAKLRR